MSTYMFVLWAVIGGITLVESEKCTCKLPVDKTPYQNVVCEAEWVIMFKRIGKYSLVGGVGQGDYRKYVGRIMAVWKPQVEEWVQQKLFKFKDKAEIFTNATCPVELKNGKQYMLSGSRLYGELVISQCDSLVLPYKAKYKDYEKNLKINFQQNCDCQVRWEEPNCVIDDVDAFFAAPGNDSCVGTVQDRHCTNAIGYCSRQGNITSACEWVHVYDDYYRRQIYDIPGNTEGLCSRSYCPDHYHQGSCHSRGMFWGCKPATKKPKKTIRCTQYNNFCNS